MKPFKHRTLKSYIGAKCRQEGGKSQAKIHDALQIANLIADDVFNNSLNYTIRPAIDYAASFVESKTIHNEIDLFLKTGARRYLQRMKKVNKKERK